ncbi:MAG: IS630 family transposase [Actinobacteria bacterium]|nr:IS630 family transposase [Actinomycetota bacterium]
MVDALDGCGDRDEPVGGQPDWRAFGLKPHQTEAFKLSPDPQLIDKVRDIVGLYLNPPEAAVVLCVDEKAQIQALDRSAPVLPLMPGVPERRSHDYVRNGTTYLYAALDVASGQVIAETTPRHRAEEFRRFLNPDRRLCAGASRRPPGARQLLDGQDALDPALLLRHPRFTLHVTPTYNSWLNLVERWLAELTTKWIKRGSHRSVRDLVASIRTWIANWNDDPKPFVWHKTADEILDSLAAYCQLGWQSRGHERAGLHVDARLRDARRRAARGRPGARRGARVRASAAAPRAQGPRPGGRTPA